MQQQEQGDFSTLVKASYDELVEELQCCQVWEHSVALKLRFKGGRALELYCSREAHETGGLLVRVTQSVASEGDERKPPFGAILTKTLELRDEGSGKARVRSIVYVDGNWAKVAVEALGYGPEFWRLWVVFFCYRGQLQEFLHNWGKQFGLEMPPWAGEKSPLEQIRHEFMSEEAFREKSR